MPNSINGLGIPTPPPVSSASSASRAAGPDQEAPLFGDLLVKSLGQVNGVQESAQAAVEKSLVGDDMSQVEAMTSMKKADLALRLMIQIRNKIMDAYSEIKQMQM